MNDDDKSKAPEQVESADSGVDPRWGALADGTLSAADAVALRAEAEQSEEGRALYELFRPFDADEKARMCEAVRARLRTGRVKRRRRTVALAVLAAVLIVAALLGWRAY